MPTPSASRVVKIPVTPSQTSVSSSSTMGYPGFKTSTPQRPESQSPAPRFFRNYDHGHAVKRIDSGVLERRLLDVKGNLKDI